MRTNTYPRLNAYADAWNATRPWSGYCPNWHNTFNRPIWQNRFNRPVWQNNFNRPIWHMHMNRPNWHMKNNRPIWHMKNNRPIWHILINHISYQFHKITNSSWLNKFPKTSKHRKLRFHDATKKHEPKLLWCVCQTHSFIKLWREW